MKLNYHIVLHRKVFKLGRNKYSFVLSLILLGIGFLYTVGTYFPESVARSGLRLDILLHFLLLQVLCLVAGYCAASKNVSNPYSLGSYPIGLIVGLLSFLGYAGSGLAVRLGYIPLGYLDIPLVILMCLGFARAGWRKYKKDWTELEGRVRQN